MQVKLISHNRRVHRKVEQDLSWYNPVAKQMEVYRGTRLSFEYDRIRRQVIPKPIVEEVPVYRNSWEDIQSVVSENSGKIDIIDIQPGFSITIKPKDVYFWVVLEKQLQKLSIRYEVEDTEYIEKMAEKYDLDIELVSDLAFRYGDANLEKHCRIRQKSTIPG